MVTTHFDLGQRTFDHAPASQKNLVDNILNNVSLLERLNNVKEGKVRGVFRYTS